MSNGDGNAAVIRRYELLGYTFESRRGEDGAIYAVPPMFESPDDLPMYSFLWVEPLFEDYFAGDPPDLPEALRERRECFGSRYGVAPISSQHQDHWTRIRTQWIEKTGIDPGVEAARIAKRDDPEAGFAPWGLLADYLAELSRDRLDAEEWWLFRDPAHFHRPRDDERDRLAPLESIAARLGDRVAPGSELSAATGDAYARFLDELGARGFFSARVGRELSTNRISRARAEALESWGFDALSSYLAAAGARRDRPVSLEWLRRPPAPPPGLDARTWLDSCLAALAGLDVPPGRQVEVEAEVEGTPVALEIRREDGDTPVLTGATTMER